MFQEVTPIAFSDPSLLKNDIEIETKTDDIGYEYKVEEDQGEQNEEYNQNYNQDNNQDLLDSEESIQNDAKFDLYIDQEEFDSENKNIANNTTPLPDQLISFANLGLRKQKAEVARIIGNLLKNDFKGNLNQIILNHFDCSSFTQTNKRDMLKNLKVIVQILDPTTSSCANIKVLTADELRLFKRDFLEDIALCSSGFFNRVSDIVRNFNIQNSLNLDSFLTDYLICILKDLATTQGNVRQNVHVFQLFCIIANTKLQITRIPSGVDVHATRGVTGLSNEKAFELVKQSIQQEYTPHKIIKRFLNRVVDQVGCRYPIAYDKPTLDLWANSFKSALNIIGDIDSSIYFNLTEYDPNSNPNSESNQQKIDAGYYLSANLPVLYSSMIKLCEDENIFTKMQSFKKLIDIGQDKKMHLSVPELDNQLVAKIVDRFKQGDYFSGRVRLEQNIEDEKKIYDCFINDIEIWDFLSKDDLDNIRKSYYDFLFSLADPDSKKDILSTIVAKKDPNLAVLVNLLKQYHHVELLQELVNKDKKFVSKLIRNGHKNFNGINLTNYDLSNLILEGFICENSDLTYIKLFNSSLKDIDLTKSIGAGSIKLNINTKLENIKMNAKDLLDLYNNNNFPNSYSEQENPFFNIINKGVSLDDQPLSAQDLSALIEFGHTNFEGANLSEQNLSCLSLEEKNFKSAKFCNSILFNSSFINCYLDNANFENAILNGVKLSGLSSDKIVLDYANLNYFLFDAVTLQNSSFRSVNLRNSALLDSEFINCNFNESSLYGSILTTSSFYKSSFKKSNLNYANLKGAKFRSSKLPLCFSLSVCNLNGMSGSGFINAYRTILDYKLNILHEDWNWSCQRLEKGLRDVLCIVTCPVLLALFFVEMLLSALLILIDKLTSPCFSSSSELWNNKREKYLVDFSFSIIDSICESKDIDVGFEKSNIKNANFDFIKTLSALEIQNCIIKDKDKDKDKDKVCIDVREEPDIEI